MICGCMPAIDQIWSRLLFWGCICALATCTATGADVAGNPLSVARNADGRLELFRVRFDGEVQHRWQKERNGDWSAWTTLGGTFVPGVAVGLGARGDLEVFAVDQTHNLNWSRQIRVGTDVWSKWNVLGSNVCAPVAVERDVDGRLEIFATDAESLRAMHRWQTNDNGGWSQWQNLGTNAVAGLAAATNADGKMELFGVDADHHLVHCGQRKINAPEKWSDWASLGGSVMPGLCVGLNDNGQLEVFAVSAATSEVLRIVQAAAGDSDHWQPWTNFGGNVKTGLTIGQNADGRLEIFAVKNGSSTLQHRFQLKRHDEDRWLGWRDLGEDMQAAPVVGRNDDGTLEIFAIDEPSGSEVKHRRQIIANYHWLYWSSMDRAPLEYSPRIWQTDEGLPNNRVQAITQTANGFLWVGTSEGLARFDGMEFNTTTTPRLKGASITALCAESDGALWIGTENAGLARLSKDRFSIFTTQDGLAGDSVRAISRDRNGAIWIATTRGLSCFRNEKFETYSTREGLASETITALCEDPGGYMWVATAKGLNCLRDSVMEAFTVTNILAQSLRSHWTVRPGTMDALAATEGLSNDSVRSLCFDRTKRLWIGSDYGLMWYDSGNFYAYSTLYGLSDNFISAIYEDRENNLWVGTYSGLNRFIDGRFHTELNNHGIPYDRINSIFEDKSGNIWVGSREGLIRLTPKAFSVQTKAQGLSHNHVTSVLEDHLGGMWVGTWGGGLNQIKEGKTRVYGATNQFSSDLILALCEGHDGSIWVGTDKKGGLSRLKDQSVTHYTPRDGLIDASVTALHEDRSGNLWVGTGRGLCRLHGESFITETNSRNLPVRAICEDASGRVWFGGDAGLMCYHKGIVENLSEAGLFPREAVSALYADSDDEIWIGTLGNGLIRLRQGRWQRYGTQEGLISNEILGIIEDHGWLWLTSTKGIFRVRRHDLEALKPDGKEAVPCVLYGKGDGLESIVCGNSATPTVWKTTDDRLCFVTTLGLAIIDARDTSVDMSPPPVSIERVEVDRKPVAILNGQSFVVPPSRGELDIRYTALDLRAPEKCRFKYRLDGMDSDWVEAGAQRTAHYNNVAPGMHRFQVVACNKDGVWNETGASAGLELQPHLWQRWWAKTLALAALLGLAGGSALFVTHRRMQRKLELLQRQHAIERERGRIARDIHDDLGSSLTRIMLLGQRARSDLAEQKEVDVHLNKIINFSHDTIQAMDEIVWAANPRNDNLNGLVNYLVEYTDQFFQDTGIRCRLQMPIASPLPLSTEVRHDLFLAIKEALNNVLKHSKATEVRVEVLSDGSTIDVIIDDNGRGFDLAHARNGNQGNGLQNLRKRMDALGGRVEIVTAPGHGTKLQFTVRVPS